jgi:hypothetical protein
MPDHLDERPADPRELRRMCPVRGEVPMLDSGMIKAIRLLRSDAPWV